MEVERRADPATAAESLTFLRDGERLYAQLLDHVHGRAAPRVTPDMRELNRLVRQYTEAVHIYVDWVTATYGPSGVAD